MSVRIIIGNALEQLRLLPDESVHCVVTSPPYYGLRDYGVTGQIGLEASPAEYVDSLVAVFREVRRVLCPDATCWINLGDSYASGGRATYRSGASDNKGQLVQNDMPRPIDAPGIKPKDLLGIPWLVAFALRADGWWLRQDIIWSKPNPMPESVTDRCTKAHEYLFLLSKSERYHYDAAAIRERAETDDLRRPYGSEGSWQLDGRPIEQRHGGELRKVKIPGAWDIGAGAHGTINRQGRTSAQYQVVKHGEAPEDYDRLRTRMDGLHGKIGRKGNAKTFRGGSYVGGVPGPRVEHGNVPSETFSRNKRSVWTVATAPFSEAHFATFPPALIEPCILAGCPKGGVVLDCFGGAGTTGLVADRLGRDAVLIELNPEYAEMARRRIQDDAGMFAEVA